MPAAAQPKTTLNPSEVCFTAWSVRVEDEFVGPRHPRSTPTYRRLVFSCHAGQRIAVRLPLAFAEQLGLSPTT